MKIYKYSLFFIILCILLVSVNTNAYMQESIKVVNIWYVGGAGSENLSSITEALSYASDGDIIYVYPNVYYETDTQP